MTTKFIEAGWKSYLRIVVPDNASDVQVNETRQAFYAGAATLWQSIMVTLDPEAEPTEQDLQRMDDIQAEVDAIGQQLDKDILNLPRH